MTAEERARWNDEISAFVTAAEESANTAEEAANRAETAKTAAETARDTTVSAKERALAAEANSSRFQTEADRSAQNAKDSEQNAAKSAERAEGAEHGAISAANTAQGYVAKAGDSANNAGIAANRAQDFVRDAAGQADRATVAANRSETAAQTAQAVADSLPDDYTTAVGKIAENTAEINNTNSNVSQLKGDIDDITHKLTNEKITQFDPKIEYLGNYYITSQGSVTSNSNYYAFIVDMSKINEISMPLVELLGYFKTKPKNGSITSDNARHENISFNKLTITDEKKYFLICRTINEPPIVKNSKESETILTEVENVNANVENLKSKITGILQHDTEFLEIDDLIVSETYIKIDGTMATGAVSVSQKIKSGETYRLKAQTGSAVRTYVITNSVGRVIRYASADSWGTNHNYDATITINENENDGTLFVNSIRNDYIGLQRLTDIYYSKAVENKLIGKTIVFDGDSICHATSERTDGKGVGRIGLVTQIK